jgi:hypothetical protein
MNQKEIYTYWRKFLLARKELSNGMKVIDVGNLVAQIHGDPSIDTKQGAYRYLTEKLAVKLDKKKTLSENTSGGSVYFIGNIEYGWVKIGLTTDLPKRLANLQTASPCKLEILGYFVTDDPKKDEKKMHQRFKSQHLHNEWFTLDDNIKAYIANLP